MGDEHQTGFQVVPICRTFVLLGSHHSAILIFHLWAIVVRETGEVITTYSFQKQV
jgi:hypothetical protein